jgi:hypothetical protein
MLSMPELDQIIDLDRHPLADTGFVEACRDKLSADGVLTLPDFLRPAALTELVAEAEDHKANGKYIKFNKCLIFIHKFVFFKLFILFLKTALLTHHDGLLASDMAETT